MLTIFDHNLFSREASFVHAISSAGVAHAVTRSCSSGLKNKIFNRYSRIDDAMIKYSRTDDQMISHVNHNAGELENCGCDRSLRGMSPEGFQARLEFLK